MLSNELAKISAIRPAIQVCRQQTLDGTRHLGRGAPVSYRPGLALVLADSAPHAEVVRINYCSAHLDLLALDADVGDPVLAAAIRATGHVDLEVLVKSGHPLLKLFYQPLGEALRLREGQLTEFRSRARNRTPPEGRGVKPHTGVLDLLCQGIGVLASQVEDEEILHDRDPSLSRAIAVS